MKIYALIGINKVLYGLSATKEELEEKIKWVEENRGARSKIIEYDIPADVYMVIDMQDGGCREAFATRGEAEAYKENNYDMNLMIVKNNI